MTFRAASLSVVLCLLALCCSTASAAPAKRADEMYARAGALLAEADFSGALELYGAAAKAAPDNNDYRMQYALVRRVIQVRASLEKQTDPARWDRVALALRSFYTDNRVHTEALKIDRQRHERQGTVDTALMLAYTHLELDQNEAAAELLGGLADPTPRISAVRGIALARLGKTGAARSLVADCCAAEEKQADPALCFDLACLHALLGDTAEAGDLLACSFQNTPPSRLDAFKTYARQRADLAGLVSSAESEEVFKTASTVKESSCSGGTSCGACPSRTTCGSGGGTEKK